MVNKIIIASLFIVFWTSMSFASGSISDNYTVGKEDYMANSVNIFLDLSEDISISAGFAMYNASATTKSYSFGTGLKVDKNSFLNINLSFLPKVENYRSNQFGFDFSRKIKDTRLKIGYSNTTHSQYIYRPVKRFWDQIDLKQMALNFGITQKFDRSNISFSYTNYNYDNDIEKISKITNYYSSKNASFSNLNFIVNGFPKDSISCGLDYDISDLFSTAFNYSSINYKIGQPKSNSYLLDLIFYPVHEIEVLAGYNNFDKINYYTIGISYNW